MTENKENLAKSFNIMGSSMAKMWDIWLVSLSSFYGMQSKLENATIKQLSQSKTAREELIKVGEDMSKQIRKNREQMQSFVVETVMNSYEHINYTNQNLISDFSKKVDDLSNYENGDLVDHMMTPLKQWLAATAANSPAN